MRIHNVHERFVAAEVDEIGRLLATLGQPEDALYPPLWKPMRFDGPIAVGASGTHGTVTAYERNRLLQISFPARTGITGTHTFTSTAVGPCRALVRHEVDADATCAAWIGWHVLIRTAHDTVLEALLDRLEAATGTPRARPSVPSPYARLLRSFERPRARAVTATQTELLANALPRVDYLDAFAIECRRDTPDSPDAWAQAIFKDLPPWVATLMGLRERLVGVMGIEGGTPDIFDVSARDDDEVIWGADAGHLDFRASVRREPRRIVVTSVVQLHNRRGRSYFALIRHIHPFVVRALLNRAASRLAGPSAASKVRNGPRRNAHRRSVNRRKLSNGASLRGMHVCICVATKG